MFLRPKWISLVTFVLFINICATQGDVNKEQIKYYEKLITDELQKAKDFQLPVNAEMHAPLNQTIEDFGTFDFIIIGAGSTGSVIASRLSEITKWKILLLEAGHYPNNFTMIPGMFAIQALTSYNWGFMSTPQKTACLGSIEKRCVIPRGKGIGGTSLINQNIYSRGNKIDYDRWARLLNDPSWKYDQVLPYFKKSEDFHKTNPDAPLDWEYHGKNGYLYTNFHMPYSNLTKLFLQANQELAENITDYNGKDQLGATILQLNIKEGRRYDQASAFIKPVKGRSNLIVSEGSYVIKIEVNKKVASGVLFTKNGKKWRARVTNDIILSAGAISSPQLLMLSGIGPKMHLKDMRIPLVQDLPVGSGLRDHVFCGIQFSSNVTVSRKNLTQKVKEYLEGYGDLAAGNPVDAAGFYRTEIEKNPNYPDLEIVVTSTSPSIIGRKFLRWNKEIWNALFNISAPNLFTLTPVLLHTKSVGKVRLRNKHPFTYPVIDVNVLSDINDVDINTMYGGIQLALNISKTSILRGIGTKLEVRQFPACAGHEFLSKQFWLCFLRQTAVPAFHPVGTCSSGVDPKEGAVVDRNLNVFGVKKLKVADASVIPFTFSGHPAAICTMIGEKISDVIKQQYIK